MRPHLQIIRTFDSSRYEHERQIEIKATCSQCKCTETFEFAAADWMRWQAGELIQNVWPLMLPNLRELLISGLCGVCFDKLFEENDNG